MQLYKQKFVQKIIFKTLFGGAVST